MVNQELNPKEVAAHEVLLSVLAKSNGLVHSTKLVKLVYLVDYLHFQHYGCTMTGFQYMWDHFGPNALGHAIVAEVQELVRAGKAITECNPNIYGGQTIDFGVAREVAVPRLPDHAEMIVDDVIRKFDQMSVEEITEYSKQTEPFKNAKRYGLLSMSQSAPAQQGRDDEWAKHSREVDGSGLRSLEEIKEKFGVA